MDILFILSLDMISKASRMWETKAQFIISHLYELQNYTRKTILISSHHVSLAKTCHLSSGTTLWWTDDLRNSKNDGEGYRREKVYSLLIISLMHFGSTLFPLIIPSSWNLVSSYNFVYLLIIFFQYLFMHCVHRAEPSHTTSVTNRTSFQTHSCITYSWRQVFYFSKDHLYCR